MLVLGATGTIGRATVRALLRHGHEVVCLVRARAGVGGALGREESARLPEMCARVAQVHEDLVARSLRTLVRLIEPVLILTFGAIVGFIALAMLQAVYSANAGVL